jgi:hypothetical protein
MTQCFSFHVFGDGRDGHAETVGKMEHLSSCQIDKPTPIPFQEKTQKRIKGLSRS